MAADGAAVSAEELLAAGLGRARRPVHQHRADDDHDPAAQARRAGRARDGHGRRLPRLMPRPTVRLRMTLLYAGVFLLAGAALLTVSYILVRNNAHCRPRRTRRNVPADELRRADPARGRRRRAAPAAHPVRDRAGRDDRAVGAAGLAGRRAACCARCSGSPRRRGASRRTRSTSASRSRARATSSRSWPTPSTRMLERLSRRLRQPAALRGQRVARAAHAADRHAHRARGDARRPGRHATPSCARWPRAVHDALDRTERLVQSLLTLARSEGAVTRRDPLDLAERRAHWPSSTPRATPTPRGLAVTADLAPRAGGAATGACSSAWWRTSSRTPSRHNRPGGRVSVTTSSRDGRSIVEVVNDGDVLDAAVAADAARALPAHRPRRPRRRRRPRALDRALGGAGARRRRRARRVPGGRPARHRDPSARANGATPTHPDRYSRERAHA